MRTQVGYDELLRMLGGAIEVIRQKNDELSLLDAAIGDGDHGVTMLRAFNKMNEVMRQDTGGDISGMLSDIAWALMDIDGGATGPLYGSLFLGMSEAVQAKPALDGEAFAEMLEGGLASLEKQTKARVGDKTMMDALIWRCRRCAPTQRAQISGQCWMRLPRRLCKAQNPPGLSRLDLDGLNSKESAPWDIPTRAQFRWRSSSRVGVMDWAKAK